MPHILVHKVVIMIYKVIGTLKYAIVQLQNVLIDLEMLADCNLAVVGVNRQPTKFYSLPNFLAMRYIHI